MINNLNFKFQTFTPPNFYSTNIIFINPNMFEIAKNTIQNSIKLEFKITDHQNNFLNELYDLIDVKIKNISRLIHQMVLFKIEIKIFIQQIKY